MSGLLIAIIYLAFISLGLPDSLLGSAWPEMYQQMNVPSSFASILTMIISSGTVISSLLSNFISKKLKTGWIVVLSTALIILGLIGFSISSSFWILCLFAIPYGLGAGSVDACLNNYVALHYSSRHMSWLHCFWGIGTIISPYLMSYALTNSLGWNTGYLLVAVIQIVVLIVLILGLPLWKKENKEINVIHNENKKQSIFKIKGVIFILFAFLCYCAAESTVMLWTSTYLFQTKGISEEIAASYGSLVFIGLTLGRFISGFVSNYFKDKKMIRMGLLISLIGMILLMIPVENIIVSIIGFIIIGFGFGPVYPSIIHSTPINFGEENSQSIIGIEMAFAYMGSTFVAPLFGLITNFVDIKILPFYLLIFIVLNFTLIEIMYLKIKK